LTQPLLNRRGEVPTYNGMKNIENLAESKQAGDEMMNDE
jgi:hypothetical protein